MKQAIVTMRCEACGHVQEVHSVACMPDVHGNDHFYFGSKYDFCEQCDEMGPEIVSYKTEDL